MNQHDEPPLDLFFHPLLRSLCLWACPQSLGYFLACDAKDFDDVGHPDLMLNPFYIRKRQPCHGISLCAQYWKADIDDAFNLIAGTAFEPSPANLCQVAVQVGWLSRLRLIAPFIDSTLICILNLVGQND